MTISKGLKEDLKIHRGGRKGYQVNIVSGFRSREMVAEIRDDSKPASFTYNVYGEAKVTFQIRRCSSYTSGQINLTGGIEISAQIPKIEPCQFNIFYDRLRPGWTTKQLEKKLSNLYFKVTQEIYRRNYLKYLHSIDKPCVDKLILFEEIERESEKTGRTMIYDDMTLKDIKEWTTYFEAILERKGD